MKVMGYRSQQKDNRKFICIEITPLIQLTLRDESWILSHVRCLDRTRAA